jgi:Uma2 family endonuclease
MTTAAPPLAGVRTVGDLLRRLGDVPPDRIRFHPTPGTATIADLLDTKRCELVDGTLVEKPVGLRQSLLASYLIHLLQQYVVPRNLGMVSGEQGTMEMLTGLVRIPDVAFLPWDRLPARRVPDEPVPNVVPTLAVEVLSDSNRPGEMLRKRREYFTAGVLLVWEIDPRTRTVKVFTAAETFVEKTAADRLVGGQALPGFDISVGDLFADLDRHG